MLKFLEKFLNKKIINKNLKKKKTLIICKLIYLKKNLIKTEF